MPNWNEVLEEIQTLSHKGQTALDQTRRKYIKELHSHTGRNVIAYYSGWLQHPTSENASLNDRDMQGFMLNIHKMDRSKGLDLILHTPGGDLTATEALVNYLKEMFGDNIRAVVPQLSMSAGTLIALSCKNIVMGKHSNLGPIDPQIGGIPCQAVLDEFEEAKKQIIKDPNLAHLWQFIISKYHPTYLSSCQNAIDMSKELVSIWLASGMFEGNHSKMEKVIETFSDHNDSKTHSRHIPISKCKELGMSIIDLEDDQKLQDIILTLHHSFMHTFSHSRAVKIIENHIDSVFIEGIPES